MYTYEHNATYFGQITFKEGQITLKKYNVSHFGKKLYLPSTIVHLWIVHNRRVFLTQGEYVVVGIKSREYLDVKKNNMLEAYAEPLILQVGLYLCL
jgi:hypothetical protein